ncbi:MAG: DUF2905 domain-containing protein [Candidatus Brocadiaceae bacterium]|jgi:ribose/xylose/arabinose/galactoside ABC-type transport system permease subunit
MPTLGKALIVLGAVLVLLGVLLLVGDRIPLLGKLPGDFRIEGERLSFHIPLTTCILLSVILTLVLNLLARLFSGGP